MAHAGSKNPQMTAWAVCPPMSNVPSFRGREGRAAVACWLCWLAGMAGDEKGLNQDADCAAFLFDNKVHHCLYHLLVLVVVLFSG